MAGSDPVDELKRALRREARARARAPAPAALSDAAEARLLASGLLDGLRTVALYVALPSEVQTDRLLRELAARSVRVALPVVDESQRRLRFRAAGGAMERTPLGVFQPDERAPAVPLEEIDAFVVPGLAADARGSRLGRGRGHYDATLLAAPRALRVGLFLESSLVAAVPVGEHDALLDAVCTDARLVLCPPRPR